MRISYLRGGRKWLKSVILGWGGSWTPQACVSVKKENECENRLIKRTDLRQGAVSQNTLKPGRK